MPYFMAIKLKVLLLLTIHRNNSLEYIYNFEQTGL